MKYIKKFNEELDANTYRKASKALSALKHTKRANKLEKHAKIISQLNKLNDLVKDLKKYTPYGIFDAGSNVGSKLKEQFALKMWYDDWTLTDTFDDYERGDSTVFCVRVSIGFLPILEEGNEEHIRDYYSQMNGDVYGDDALYDELGEMEDTKIGRICQYFDQYEFLGAFNGPSIYVKMAIENDKIIIKGIDVDDDSEDVLNILGRKSGVQLKNLLVKLFSNETFYFPTHNNQNLQQVIKYELCEKTGFSTKYQFSFGEIGEFIKKTGINEFYNSFDFVN
jgi:hypothetical protein